MRRPNFFLVGAPRSATTAMYTCLKQHPEIHVAVQKEPHFFGSDLTPMPGMIREEALYLSLFAGAGDRPRVGEGSVWYLLSRRAAAEVKAYSPEAKILILLREPVQMARSLYGLYRRTGNEDLPTFEAAIDAEPERREGRRIPPGAYFPEGLLYTDVASYAEKVTRWVAAFGRDNVLCILFDDFVRDTAAAYRQALRFLGVDEDFQAELDPRKARLKVRLQAVRELRELPPEVRGRVQGEHIRQHEAGGPPPPLPADLAARLREVFAEDVARLGALLGRDLAAWTAGPGAGQGSAARADRVGSGRKGAGQGAAEESGARAAGGGGGGLREALETVRLLKKIPPEVRAKFETVETLEHRVTRWQKTRAPEVPLEQRPFDDAWARWFAAERGRIAGALGPSAEMIEHFGSTSIPGLSAKNIVDIAVAVAAGGPPLEASALLLADAGYELYGNSPLDPETLWLWKSEADRAFVIHLCGRQRPWLDEQMDLRDYLRSHAEERERYAELKRRLAADAGQSLLTYTLGKLSLSIEMIDRAREWKVRG